MIFFIGLVSFFLLFMFNKKVYNNIKEIVEMNKHIEYQKHFHNHDWS